MGIMPLSLRRVTPTSLLLLLWIVRGLIRSQPIDADIRPLPFAIELRHKLRFFLNSREPEENVVPAQGTPVQSQRKSAGSFHKFVMLYVDHHRYNMFTFYPFPFSFLPPTYIGRYIGTTYIIIF